MLNFVDETEAIDEPKNTRMEQQTKPHVKAKIKAAAALLGIDETAFVTSVAYQKALAVIDEHARTKLTQADTEKVLAALEAPPNPSKELKELFELHDRLVISE